MSPVNCPTCKLAVGPPTYTSVQRCPRCFGELPQQPKGDAGKQAAPPPR